MDKKDKAQMAKMEIVTEFRKLINAQTEQLIDVQSSIVSGDHKAFDKMQAVINSNFRLWEELFDLEYKN